MKEPAIILCILSVALSGCASGHLVGAGDSVGPIPKYITSVQIEDLNDAAPSRVFCFPKVFPVPVFPPAYERTGVGGKVALRFVVKPDGSVSSLKVESSNGADFEAAAISAVSQWKFAVRALSNQPVPEEIPMTVRIIFAAAPEEPNQSPEPTAPSGRGSS